VDINTQPQYPARGFARLNYPLLHKLDLLRYTRNLTQLHQLLYSKRLAVPLGVAFIREGRRPDNKLQYVVGRVRAVVSAELPQ
jgi:hypothetical protein